MRRQLIRAFFCAALLGSGVARAEVGENPNAPTSDSSNVREGELTSVGATTLQTRGTRIGIRAGPAKIGQVFYLSGAVEGDLAIKQFQLGLGLPVNIPFYDPSKGLKVFPDGMSLRQQDYAIPQNYVRLLRYLTYGNKEGDIFLNFSQQYAATIGHGGAMRRYVTNLDVDQMKLAGEFDMKFKYGGFETFVGDVLDPGRTLGALVYLKPFGGFSSLVAQKLSFGVTYAGDLVAPLSLKKDVNGIPVLTDSRAPSPVVENKDLRQVHIVGVSVETKVVRTENVDIKPYIYADQMMVGGGKELQLLGKGLSIGALGRFGIGEGGRHAFRVVLEGRVFENNFQPGYFDSFYQIQRYQYFGAGDNPASAPTKLAEFMNRDNSLKFGGMVEAQYAWGRHFSVLASLEDSNARGGRNAMLHFEVPTFRFVRLFGSVYYRGIEGNVAEAGKSFGKLLKADNTTYFAGARVMLLPILFVNLRAFRSYQIDQANTNNSYRNIDGFSADLEVGYEFSRR